VFDSVSLYPAANVAKAAALGLLNPWPFREDLLGLLRDLRPAFIRLPGGCYVEGDWMRNAFRWKPSVGANEARPGHYNGVWGYWSTDGMGIFELMQLAQELSAEAVWVVNNGVAHGDSE
jgi:alpha-N-arabinofuranosidase